MNYNDFIMSMGQDEKILEFLSHEEKSYVNGLVNERNREIARIECMMKRDELNRKKETEMKRNELLGLKHGEWVRNIPKYERFVIAVRDGKRFIGNTSSDLEDPTKWKSIKECCAIDILRGYKFPYWGYYGVTNDDVERQANAFYKHSVSQVMNAKNDDELVKVLVHDWDFFMCDDHGESDIEFGILDYIVDSTGKITIIGESEYKTWREHREDLKSKYMNSPP